MQNMIPTHAMPVLFASDEVKPAPLPGRNFSTHFEKYIKSSAELAKQILEPKEYGSVQDGRRMGHVHVTNYNFGTPFSLFTPAIQTVHHVHHYPQGQYGRKEDEDKPSSGLRILVGLGAAILGGFAIFHVGNALSHLDETSKEIAYNKKYSSDLSYVEATDLTGQAGPYVDNLKKIAEKRDSIFSRIKTNAVYKLVLTTVAVAAAAFALIGAIFASYSSMGIGLLLGLAAGGVFLFKLGYGWNDKKDSEDAQAIKQAVENIKGQGYLDTLVRAS